MWMHKLQLTLVGFVVYTPSLLRILLVRVLTVLLPKAIIRLGLVIPAVAHTYVPMITILKELARVLIAGRSLLVITAVYNLIEHAVAAHSVVR